MGSSEKVFRIGVVAPGGGISREIEGRVKALVAEQYAERIEVEFDPQCFVTDTLMAGADEVRLEAFARAGESRSLNAVWFARGGYGSCRIAERAVGCLGMRAQHKAWMGYSDMGFMLASLKRAGYTNVAHGPMPGDIMRPGGEMAVKRALDWLYGVGPGGVEANAAAGAPCLAFNLSIACAVVGSGLEPDLAGRVLMLEELGEHLYRIDRLMFSLTSHETVRRCAGIRLGRISEVLENDRPFGHEVEEMMRYWCERSGIAYLGRADIGHDADNKIVPFG